MTHDDFDEPTETERAAFQALPRESPPPEDLEDRVVAALRARGILRAARVGGRRTMRATLFVAASAAAAALFMAGLVTGRHAAAPEVLGDTRPQFVLLLQEGKGFDRGTDHLAEYAAWARALGARGELVAGEKLKDDAVLLSNGDTGLTIRTVAVEGAEDTPRGYFVIRARDLAEAIAIARDCPHLKHGGRIALRPIDKV
jgi:hypothetical protein